MNDEKTVSATGRPVDLSASETDGGYGGKHQQLNGIDRTENPACA